MRHCHFLNSTCDIGDPPSRAPVVVVGSRKGEGRGGVGCRVSLWHGIWGSFTDRGLDPVWGDKQHVADTLSLDLWWSLIAGPCRSGGSVGESERSQKGASETCVGVRPFFDMGLC